MTRTESIRRWLQANPGWHFPADVAADLGTAGVQAIATDLSYLARRKGIERSGRRGMFKYRALPHRADANHQESSNGKRP